MNIPLPFFSRNFPRIRPLIFFAAACVLAFTGCKTAPPALPPVHPAAALPQKMDAYFYLSMEENKDLIAGFIDKGMGGRYFLEHTLLMYGAIRRGAAGGGLMIAAK
ncbi:MAG: hypothetical protein FWG35_08500, partial [Spirochaetaceae bacterium]|nr:hypothetical protein [Spirochaetaceae bacterium]